MTTLPLPVGRIICFISTIAISWGGMVKGQTDVALPADAGVYNVKDFGATGNGSTDDTAAFQNAIAATFNGALTVGTNVWSFGSGGSILKGGTPTGATNCVGMFNNATTFVQVSSSGVWSSWNGSSFVSYTPSTIGGCSTLNQGSSSSIVIGSDTWTLNSSGTANRNGASSGKTAVGLFNNNGTLELLDSSGGWYEWSATSYIQIYPSYLGTSATIFVNRTSTGIRYGANTELYIPNGTYILSSTLQNSDGTTWRAGMYLQGQSQTGTILKLKNNLSYFGSASSPKGMIQTGAEGADSSGVGATSFYHYIRNLTLDVGSGNPGAAGIDLLINNRGGIYNVTIQSSDTGYVGYAGIMMERGYPGPGIVKDVTITGFSRAVSMQSQFEYSMTFENIAISHQLTYGFDVGLMAASINYLTSTNSVPVISTGNVDAHIDVLNSVFNGGASGSTAIQGSGAIYCRNVMSTGYGTVVGSLSGGSSQVLVPEYESASTYKSFSSDISGAISLPIKPTPHVNSVDMNQWKNGANAATVTNGDYLASIQAAIDSGKPIVYLPQGQYLVSNTIHLRGSLQKLVGCNAMLGELSSFPSGAPLIQNDSAAGSTVLVQNISPLGSAWFPVTQNSSGTLILQNSNSTGYCNTSSGTGDVFLEDVYSVTQPIQINYPQNVWARQLDIELQAATNPKSWTNVSNNGGNLWILGYKTEENSNNGPLLSQTGGWTELIGGFFYNITANLPGPAIVNNGGALSASFGLAPNCYYSTYIQDTENGTTLNFNGVAGEYPNEIPLYSGAAATFLGVPTIVNGSFEIPFQNGGATYQPIGGYWNFNPGSGIEGNGSPFVATAAPDGVQAALLQSSPGTPGSFGQLVYFPAGTFQINFKAALRNSYGSQQSFNVMLGSSLIGSYSPTSASFTSFQSNPFAIPSAGSYNLSFLGTGTSADSTDFIDSICVAKPAITGLYNTGQGLGDAQSEPNWTITSSPGGGTGHAYVVNQGTWLFSHWFGDSTTSKWIDIQAAADAGDPPGVYTYHTTYTENSSSSISVSVAADDSISAIRVNGNAQPVPSGTGYTNFSTLTIPASASHLGSNTLDFDVTNAGASSNPAGFRAEFGLP